MEEKELPSKGFQNDQGQNNCFLNVGLQALWHITSFNKGFDDSKHVHQEPCVICALQVRILSLCRLFVTEGTLGHFHQL